MYIWHEKKNLNRLRRILTTIKFKQIKIYQKVKNDSMLTKKNPDPPSLTYSDVTVIDHKSDMGTLHKGYYRYRTWCQPIQDCQPRLLIKIGQRLGYLDYHKKTKDKFTWEKNLLTTKLKI